MEIIDAELRLGPPGSDGDAVVAAAKKRSSSTAKSEASGTDDRDATPASKVQAVGWPPVGAYRKNTFQAAAEAKAKAGEQEGKKGGGLYVKVSMDGAPYLRKVDLRMYGGYRELRVALNVLC